MKTLFIPSWLRRTSHSRACCGSGGWEKELCSEQHFHPTRSTLVKSMAWPSSENMLGRRDLGASVDASAQEARMSGYASPERRLSSAVNWRHWGAQIEGPVVVADGSCFSLELLRSHAVGVLDISSSRAPLAVLSQMVQRMAQFWTHEAQVNSLLGERRCASTSPSLLSYLRREATTACSLDDENSGSRTEKGTA